MSTMRWADSDSSDEEAAYIPPSKSDAAPPPHQQDDIQPSKQPVKVQPQPAPPKTSLQALTVGGQGEPRRNNHTGTRGRGRGGRSADVRPGGNRGDWKQMAKDQSQLKPKLFHGNRDPIDGSAWMAQRRAKMQEEQQENEERAERQRKTEMEEKRLKRKEQLGALKKAMVEIKSTEPPPSPSADNFKKAGIGRSSVTILKKLPEPEPQPHSEFQKTQSPSSRRNDTKKQAIPRIHKFNITIGQDETPRGELQSNGTVKFSRTSSSNEITGRKLAKSVGTNLTTVADSDFSVQHVHQDKDDDRSLNSKGSKGSWSRGSGGKHGGRKGPSKNHPNSGRNSRGRGRGGRNQEHQPNTPPSEISTDRRRGGGGGRGARSRSRGSRGRGRTNKTPHHGQSQHHNHSYEIGK